MTPRLSISCDAPLCTEHTDQTTGDVPTARRRAKKSGWVRALVNGQPADYCAKHANYRTIK